VLSLALQANGYMLAAAAPTACEAVEPEDLLVRGACQADGPRHGWPAAQPQHLRSRRRRLRPEKNGELKVFHFDRQPPPSLHRVDPNGLWSMAVVAGGPDHRLGRRLPRRHGWDVTKPEPRLFRQTSTSLAVALSPDGKLLAAAPTGP